MLKNVREKTCSYSWTLARGAPARPEDLQCPFWSRHHDSELKRAFEIGLPCSCHFSSSTSLSLRPDVDGMMMLPPVVGVASIQTHLLRLVDGWTLVAGSLVQSYGASGPILTFSSLQQALLR